MKLRVILLFSISIVFSSCHIGRFFGWNFADIKDHNRFQSVPVANEGVPFKFKDRIDQHINFPKQFKNGKKMSDFKHCLSETKTVAFLVIRNDTVLFEEYYRGGDKDMIVPSFSMAKSFVSALTGIAISEGYINNVHDPIDKYIPELKDPAFSKVSIEHLLNMRSGIKFSEFYLNPFADIAKYYYGRKIPKYITNQTVDREPGTAFKYISLNPQLLGIAVSRTTGKSLSQNLEEKIWKPLGMEYPASWSIDSKKSATEKAFCCINARAIDYAKFGRLYLNKGRWEGKQIIPMDWVRRSTQVFDDSNYMIYSYQWWHSVDVFPIEEDKPDVEGPHRIIQRKSGKYIVTPSGDFYARGYKGQYIYVYPQKNIIIVRLGAKRGDVIWNEFFREIARMN